MIHSRVFSFILLPQPEASLPYKVFLASTCDRVYLILLAYPLMLSPLWKAGFTWGLSCNPLAFPELSGSWFSVSREDERIKTHVLNLQVSIASGVSQTQNSSFFFVLCLQQFLILLSSDIFLKDWMFFFFTVLNHKFKKQKTQVLCTRMNSLDHFFKHGD